ncbi:hypothetical protein L1887_47928 [Cichorium endivia]|nr:hypothetical protein L1887_47928 [Cichorium endivia]
MISAGFEPATSSVSPNDPRSELLRRRANQLRQETHARQWSCWCDDGRGRRWDKFRKSKDEKKERNSDALPTELIGMELSRLAGQVWRMQYIQQNCRSNSVRNLSPSCLLDSPNGMQLRMRGLCGVA